MKTKLFTLLLAIMACATLSAKTLFAETFETRRGSTYIDKALQSESGFTYWPYASQWFTGYTAQNDKIVDGNQYDNDYTAVESYTVSIRCKKLNGAPKTSVGMYFATGKEEARNYVRFDGGLPEIPAKGASLFVEICSSETDGGDLSTMVVKVNDETLEVPATTLGNQYVTSTVEIALKAGQINSLYIAFNNVPSQKFISKIVISSSSTTYTLSTAVNDPELGSVSGGGSFSDCPRDVILTAIPVDWSHFVQWSDGNTDNPRTIKLTQDTTVTAVFAINQYSINVSCDEQFGHVEGENGEFDYLTEHVYKAVANYGYHFGHWSDGNTDNPRVITLRKNMNITAIFDPNIYTISDNSDKSQGYIANAGTHTYLSEVLLKATPYYGYHFTKWSDGIKENPRTIILTQDTIFGALFEIDRSGACGDNNTLKWEYDVEAKSLTIKGNGTLNSNYTFGVEAPENMQKVVIESGVSSVGNGAFKDKTTLKEIAISHGVNTIKAEAFAGCMEVTTITFGANLQSIGSNAFNGCKRIEEITIYAERVIDINETTFANIGKKEYVYVYVPEGSLRKYERDDYWSEFDLRVIGATTTTVVADEVNVEPASNTADVTWPAVENAATYELTIKDKNGNVICTLVFNAQGQLTSIAFAAPSRTQTAAQATGFTFTVTGLDSGSSYGFTMDAKDSNGTVLDTKEGSFTTTGGIVTAVDNTSVELKLTKVLRNGQLFILRGDKTYTVQGQEMR